jgi:hypothetical protein
LSQLTTIQQINIEKVSQYLCAEDIAKGALFGPRLAPTTPIILYMERMAVQWKYNLSPTDSTLVSTGNYLYSLCKFSAKAQNIINIGGGGGVSPVTPTVRPGNIQFTVGAGQFMQNGDITKQFPSSWIGFDLQFFRGTTIQRTNAPLFGTYYSWDKTTALLTLLAIASSDPSAQNDEEFQFWPI